MAGPDEEMIKVVIFNDDTCVTEEDFESYHWSDIASHDGEYSRRTYTRAQCVSLGLDLASHDEASDCGGFSSPVSQRV